MPVPAGPGSVIGVDEVKLRLNKTLTVDDDEIQSMIDAAEAEYAEYVGPISGTVTETFRGGSTSHVLRAENATALTAISYDSGTTLSLSDLTLDTATSIVRWGWGTVGRFTAGTWVTVTYTVGSLPANHREAIIADVAGYFQVTQRGGAGRPQFAGEAGYEEAYASTPQVLFPRIRALAGAQSVVA